LEVVQLLLKAKANPDHQVLDGRTALMFAKHVDIAQQLLDYGADPNICDRHGCTAVHYNIVMLDDTKTQQLKEKMMCDKLEILQLLIIRGIDVNIKAENGLTALMIASSIDCAEAVNLLLQGGADPNIVDINKDTLISNLPETHTIGLTALLFSCVKMNLEVTELLLKANANPNQENALALMIAAYHGNPDIVQQLLKYGADPNSISNFNGCTTFHCALLGITETPYKDKYFKKKISITLAIIQQLLEKGVSSINIQLKMD